MKTKLFSKNDLLEAAKLLKAGELVAFPTETVYGLGALASDEDAVKKLFATKGRPSDNPLILHVAEPIDHPLAERFFPGPLTLIIERPDSISPLVTGGLDTIAVRMPSHPIALELIQITGEPLAAPSANLSGRPSPTCAQHVLDDFGGKVAGVIDGGPCAHGIESTVVDLVNFDVPTLLRPGAIPREALGIDLVSYTRGPKASPGMKYRHYAPNAQVELITDSQEARGKLLIGITEQNLYSRLRTEDNCEILSILIDETMSEALLNRLSKAAGIPEGDRPLFPVKAQH